MIGAFFRSSERVERDEFHVFVKDVLKRHPEIHSLAWRQHVEAASRVDFESELHRDGFISNVIDDVAGDGRRFTAAIRPDYYPVRYSEPEARGIEFIGMDRSELPGRNAIYQQAIGNPGFAVSGLIELEKGESLHGNPAALLVYLPVFSDGSASPGDKPSGIAVAVLQIEKLVESSLYGLDRTETRMRLIDVGASTENRILYRYPANAMNDGRSTGERFKSRFDLQFGGRILNVEYSGDEEYRPDGLIYPGVLLCAGLLLTLLICLYIRAAKLRVAEVESIARRLTDQVEARKTTEQILRASEERLQIQNSTLMSLASQEFYSIDSLDRAFNIITEASAKTLGTERAGIWLFNESNSAINCADLYELANNCHSKGAELDAREYPAYFQALQEHRAMAIDDAHHDPRSSEFSANYLTPNRIGAMLDSPIRLGGKLIGVVCNEHRGPTRQWTLDEQNFAGSIANLVSLALKFWQHRCDVAALRLNESRYRSLVLATAQIVWTCAPNGETVEASTTWEAFTGQTFDQYRGWGWVEAVHPDDRHLTGVGKLWESDGSTDRRHETEYRIRRRDGVYRLFRVRGNEVSGEDERVQEWVGTCHDITEIRAAEIALHRSHLELEQKVADRTRELKEANKQLKELDRLKSEFLATMSHELRTPLNSIIGFTSILGQGIAGPVNAEQAKQLGMVKNSASHLLGLINDLLDLSRIESGRMQTSRESFSCEYVVTEVIEALSPLAAQKGLELAVKIPRTLPDLTSDRKKVFQILLNLANNAIKFTEQGRVEILADMNRDWYWFRVTDTGIGIRSENMAMLFEAFRQIEGSARRRYEGTGLGLYLSQRLAELLRGRIEAESTFGQGSRFTLFLPSNEVPS